MARKTCEDGFNYKEVEEEALLSVVCFTLCSMSLAMFPLYYI